MPDLACNLVEVRALEERAFNAWMPLETMLVGGWVLRFADGYTKRANSINAWSPEISALDIATIAHPIYAARRLPLIFRLSPLARHDADATLAAAGYGLLDETHVLTAPISAGSLDPAVAIMASPDRNWADGFAHANRVAAPSRVTHDAMLARIRNPAVFASLVEDGRPLAWGFAVAERGMIGLFDIATSPEARRRGIGRRLVTSLLAWGRTQGASRAYLQVVASNVPALALYRQLGFVCAYKYHYRIAP